MSEPEADRTGAGLSNDGELAESVSRLMRGLNHDLKNPLGAADGYLDLMLQGFRGDLTDEQRQTLERVRVLIASGIGILEDVVTFTRASLGELPVRALETDLNSVARMTLEGHRQRAEDADIALDFITTDAPARAVTDPELAARILSRLLANALDHTPEGGRVEVSVKPAPDTISILVSDNGPGIEPEDRERCFREFERGSPPVRTRVTSGVGFGLPLARALASHLGGMLELRSESGRGSTFELVLPASETVNGRQ